MNDILKEKEGEKKKDIKGREKDRSMRGEGEREKD